MAKYSDSDEEYRKSKKKKKRLSRSPSSESSRQSSKSHKKKSKNKRRSRSRSKSSERSRRRRSRSRSRDRRSRSTSGSRQRDRRRSLSRSRRSKSRSRERRRSRSGSRNRHGRRSRSRSNSRPRYRRSRSPSLGRSRRSRSREKTNSRSGSASKTTASVKSEKSTMSDIIPGFENMTPSQQVEARMKMALKAAAAADEKIRQQTGFTSLTAADSQQRTQAIHDIESDSFTQSTFISSKSQKKETIKKEDGASTHEDAIFGTGVIKDFSTTTASQQRSKQEPDSIMHPNLFVTAEEKMDHWIKKLTEMRQRKLEGDALAT